MYRDDYRVRGHVFHAMIKLSVDSRSTCPIPVNSWLDPALFKDLDAFDGFKLYYGVYRDWKLLCKEVKNLSWVLFGVDEWTENMCNIVLKNNTECSYSDYVELIGDVVAENIPVFILNYGVRLLRCFFIRIKFFYLNCYRIQWFLYFLLWRFCL